MNFLQLNKFSNLHDGRIIIFCKTDYLVKEFKRIEKLKNEVILISGNSDLGIDEKLIAVMPDNIKTWYCQNKLVAHEKLKVIPIGLENTFLCKRKNHGVAWPHAIEKLAALSELNNEAPPSKSATFIYGNFNAATNIGHRAEIKDICLKQRYIRWQDPALPYPDFIKSVSAHKATVCPQGNGFDTHRIYEVLYNRRIPIVFRTMDCPVYDELYAKLPVVMLGSIKDLANEKKMAMLIEDAANKQYDANLLDFDFWQTNIKEEAKEINIKTAKLNKNTLFNFFNFFGNIDN